MSLGAVPPPASRVPTSDRSPVRILSRWSEWIEASAPARVDLAGGTLDLWPLHVLHPGSVTVNVAIDLRARCRVRRRDGGVSRLGAATRASSGRVARAAGAARRPATAPSSALSSRRSRSREPREIELSTEVPFGSGLGGSSALTVALAGALERARRGTSRASAASTSCATSRRACSASRPASRTTTRRSPAASTRSVSSRARPSAPAQRRRPAAPGSGT